MEHTVVQQLIEEAKAREQSPPERALLTAGALPVPWAWVEGSFGVTPNGEVVYADENGQLQSLEVLGDAWRNALVTLVYAAKSNPDLKSLLPQKPDGVPDCSGCEGKGTIANLDLLCGDCHGLGWRLQPKSAFLSRVSSLLRRIRHGMTLSTMVACAVSFITGLVVGVACIALFMLGLLGDFSEITGVYHPPFIHAGLPMAALLGFSLAFAYWRLSAARVFATVSVLLFFGYVLLFYADARPTPRWGDFIGFLGMAGLSLFANWWIASLVRQQLATRKL